MIEVLRIPSAGISSPEQITIRRLALSDAFNWQSSSTGSGTDAQSRNLQLVISNTAEECRTPTHHAPAIDLLIHIHEAKTMRLQKRKNLCG